MRSLFSRLKLESRIALLPAIAWVIAALALWLGSIELPRPPINQLEIWETLVSDAHAHDRQFGTDFIFTYGPWAFLELDGHLPATLEPKLVWEVFGKLIFNVTLLLLSARLPLLRRWLFVALLIVTAHFFDNAASVMIALLTLQWLLPAAAAWWQRGLALAWLSFLAHFKFVFFLQAAAGIGVVLFVHLAERRWRTALGLGAAFLAAYLAWWVAAGQRLAHLPAFLRLSSEISSGYSWAMALPAEPGPLAWGLIAILFCAAFAVLLARAELTKAQRVGAILIAVANWFVAWKQGFTRADLHVFSFFLFCLVFGAALPGLFGGRRRWTWADLNAGVCVAGIGFASTWILGFGPTVTWMHWRTVPRDLFHFRVWREHYDQFLESQLATNRDPVLRDTIGTATVDLFNFEQARLLLNELHYQPRPVPQSYSVYTPALDAANQHFFQSDRAPEFVIVRLDTIDGRYPGQDDAPALIEIARRYSIAKVTGNYAILHRNAARDSVAGNFKRVALAQHVPHDNDDILVPDGGGHPVWAQIDFRPTLLGRLRAFLYHATTPKLVVTLDDGQQREFAVVPSNSTDGFLIRPLMGTHLDFAALVSGRALTWPKTIRLKHSDPLDRWWWNRPHVQFFALSDLPFQRASLADQIFDAGIINVVPSRLHSDLSVEIREVEGRMVLFAHAPSEIAVPVPTGSRRFTGRFGFVPGAYLEGQTDGAEFAIDVVRRDGQPQRIWSRTLEPKTRAEDRGIQSFDLALPADAGSLKLSIGPRANTSWDWTYWSELRMVTQK